MDIDFSTLSNENLKLTIKVATAQLELNEKNEELKALNEIRRLAQKHGKRVIVTTIKKPSPPVKYVNPDNPAQTWSGRGLPPKWMKNQLQSDKTGKSKKA